MIQSYIIFILYSSTDYIYHLPIVEPFRKRTIQGCGQATYPSEFRLDWCVGEQCFDHSISCAQFQMRLKAYYQDVLGKSWLPLLFVGIKGKSTENHGVLLQKYRVSYGFLQICLTPSSWCREMHPPHYPTRHVAGGPKCLAHAGDSESVQIEND